MPTHENPPSVLLLEDNQDLADEIIYFLQNKNISISHSDRLTSLLNLIEQQRFDVLLLDRLLPEGDALAFLALIKKKHFGKIIFISALTDCADKIAGIDMGADLYLTKPINMDELFAYINRFTQAKTPVLRIKEDKPIWQLDGDLLIAPNDIGVLLTMRESLMIKVLIESEGVMVERKTLLNHLGEDIESFDFRRLDSALYRIRKKVQTEAGWQLPVKTFNRLGYSWQV